MDEDEGDKEEALNKKQITRAREDNYRLVLESGKTLTARQSQACILAATTTKTSDEIAREAGYSCGPAVRTFLRSEKGKEGLRVALSEQITRAGPIGIATLMEIAKHDKSGRNRLDAAKALTELAGIKEAFGMRPQEHSSAGQGDRPVNISINLGHKTQGETINAEAKEIEQDDGKK